jgi:hypothetical protein
MTRTRRGDTHSRELREAIEVGMPPEITFFDRDRVLETQRQEREGSAARGEKERHVNRQRERRK